MDDMNKRRFAVVLMTAFACGALIVTGDEWQDIAPWAVAVGLILLFGPRFAEWIEATPEREEKLQRFFIRPVNWIAERPLQIVLLAIGIGFVVGVVDLTPHETH